jgi:signal transduction histidine kinase
MTQRTGRAAACSGLLVLLFAASSEAAMRHVLVLQSLERGNLTLDNFTHAFRAFLDERVPDTVRVTQFVVQPSGLDEIPEQAIIEFLRSAYANGPDPDLVITAGSPAAAFARKHRDQLFPKSPLLFAAVDQRFLLGAPLAANETAVAVHNDMPGRVDDILRLFPQTSTMFMVSGGGPLGRFWHRELERDFQRFEPRIKFVWSDEASLAELLQRVATLPPNSAIFYITFGADAAGGAYSEERVLAAIHAAANAPLFGGQAALLGHGIVGGRLVSIDELGQVAADVALRILNGESPGAIKTPPQERGAPTFDWRELQRWDVSESRLSAGSVVRFRNPGAWDRFKWVIIGSASALVAQAALIVGLVVQRSRRRRTEHALRLSYEQNQDLAGRLIKAQEDERARIARDLHDDLSQQLAGVSIILSGLKRTIGKRGADPEIEQKFVTLQERTAAAATAVRNLSHELHPGVLEHAGLTATLRGHCADTQDHHQVTVAFSPADGLDSLDLDVAICVFRVVQEALANAVRHAHACTIGVTLRMDTDGVELSVVDDGVGFVASERTESGLGLRSIHERVRFMRGSVSIDSRPGEGTRVRVRIPIGPAHNAPSDGSPADR